MQVGGEEGELGGRGKKIVLVNVCLCRVYLTEDSKVGTRKCPESTYINICDQI